MKLSFLFAAAVMAVAAFADSASARTISGIGASFPAPLYVKWAKVYNKQTGIDINYRSSNSGNGVNAIKGNTVVFGATDVPLSGGDLKESGLVQFPTVIGGVVPIVNLEGVKPGDLTLDGATLAKVFLGQIRQWDDAAIKTLNPDIKLPSRPIAVVRRADASGTTFAFTSYLSRVSAGWKDRLGAGTNVQWPVGLGAPGNDGVANNVAKIAGSIGYVEYAYARKNNLSFAKLENRNGKIVTPDIASFQAAVTHADWSAAPGFGVVLVDAAGDGSWPITAATFVLVHRDPKDPAATAAVLRFFDWAYDNGAPYAEELSYIPLPGGLVRQIRDVWAAEVKTN